ncbi:MAG: SCO family protein [Myxococcota bacterium]
MSEETPGTASSTTPDTPEAAPVAGGRLPGPLIVAAVFGVMISMTLGAIVAPTLAMRGDQAELEDYGVMPSFEMLDHTGKRMTERNLRDRVIIANFIFTRCNTICPVFTAKMRRIQDDAEDLAEELKFVSFTVDPAHDTPEVLAEYAEAHRADPGRWRFLTGDIDMVKFVGEQGFKLALEQQGYQSDGAPNFVHAEHFVLIDREGHIRGYYNSNEAKRIQRMLRDARRLVIRSR